MRARLKGLGGLGNKTRDEVVSDVGNPVLACIRPWCWCWPSLVSSETLELGQGMQCRQQLGAQEWLKDKLDVMNYCKGIESSNEANYRTEHHCP